jgi:hypothetical protein
MTAAIRYLRCRSVVGKRSTAQKRLSLSETSSGWHVTAKWGMLRSHVGPVWTDLVRDALRIVQPETVIRWHRAGFRAYWRWNRGVAEEGQRCRGRYAD